MRRVLLVLLTAAIVAPAPLAPAATPVPITAEQAFDAVQRQTDPQTGLPGRVLLVDVRTRAEYYWVGTAAKVNSIALLDGTTIVPDLGKVVLDQEGKFLVYSVESRNRRTLVDKVSKLSLSPIAYSVPYQLWNEANRSLVLNTDFLSQMQALAGSDRPVLILFCRSGGRTDGTNCAKDLGLDFFSAIYEIDQPDGATNHGGMEGSAYSNVYNGYRGFPGRLTWTQTHPSASWKDAGLPIVVGAAPPALPAP
jgi:rhodanese-related sulfurtransferase